MAVSFAHSDPVGGVFHRRQTWLTTGDLNGLGLSERTKPLFDVARPGRATWRFDEVADELAAQKRSRPKTEVLERLPSGGTGNMSSNVPPIVLWRSKPVNRR